MAAKKKAKRNLRKEVQRALRKFRLTDTQLANVTMTLFIGACMRLGFSEKQTVTYLRKEAKCLFDMPSETPLETDVKTAIEMDRKGIKGPNGRKKSAAAGGK